MAHGRDYATEKTIPYELMDRTQFGTLHNAILRLDDRIIQETTRIKQEIKGLVSHSELAKALMDHINNCPYHTRRGLFSRAPKPPTDSMVTWGTVLKYTSILFTAAGAGFALAKYIF